MGGIPFGLKKLVWKYCFRVKRREVQRSLDERVTRGGVLEHDEKSVVLSILKSTPVAVNIYYDNSIVKLNCI